MTITVTGAKAGTPKPRIWQRIRGRSIRVRVRFRMGRHTNYLQEIMANGWEWNEEEWEPTPKGTTIKVFGLTDISALWRLKRVKKGGWGHLLDSDHETSDRIVAVWQDDGVRLVAYPYRNGSGPSTDGESFSQSLCTVPVSKDDPAWTEWAEIDLRTVWYDAPPPISGYWVWLLDWTIDGIFQPGSCRSIQGYHALSSPRRTSLQWLTWSHGRNGGDNPGLAQPVQYELEVL